MRIVDCHVHQSGEADPKSVLKKMDAGGVDRLLVISPAERRSIKATRQNLLVTKRLFDEAPDRISGLARVEPTIPGITGLVAASVVVTYGFRATFLVGHVWITAPVTVIWIGGMTNAFNFLDNMDGLSSGVAGNLAPMLPQLFRQNQPHAPPTAPHPPKS